jgi:hypothetical protein
MLFGGDILIETLLLLIFSLLMGIGSLGVAGWLALSGQFASLDGLFLTMTALLVALVFFLNFAWNLNSQELTERLNARLAPPREPSPESASHSKTPEKEDLA